jgi:hypothetical protein
MESKSLFMLPPSFKDFAAFAPLSGHRQIAVKPIRRPSVQGYPKPKKSFNHLRSGITTKQLSIDQIFRRHGAGIGSINL